MSQAAAGTETGNPLRVKIAGMDCGSCALTIENSIRQLSGVESVAVSFTTETMEVTGSPSLASIEQRLKELGYRLATDASQATTATPAELHGATGFLRFLWNQRRLRVALVVAVAVLLAMPVLANAPPILGIASLDLLFTLAVVIAGIPIFIKGMRALIFARRITIDLLMAIAAAGALAIGATGEAITVILLFTLGEALEAYSAERARGSLRSLLSLQPQEATVLREHRGGHDGHDHGHADASRAVIDSESGLKPLLQESHEDVHYHPVVVAVDQVAVADIVLVRPGQRIPVDGAIITGASSINQAAVTGESVPVLRAAGDDVMAGTVNGEGALEIRVTRAAGDATIARIARLVEQAQSQRSPAERFIDRFARYYTPAVVLLACLVVALPVLAFGQPLLDTAGGVHGWLYRGLALLIIACPCALVISIPVTVVSGLTRLANLGVLVKGGAQLDRLADVRVVAFDKTGTLTHGRPQVTAVRARDCAHAEDITEACEPCADVVALAASVERSSEHPVAHAIVAAASVRRIQHRYQAAGDVTAHAGRGVVGQLGNGIRIAVGSDSLFSGRVGGHGHLSCQADGAQDAGNTVMFVARDDNVIGFISVQDEVRDASRGALEELRRAIPSIAAVMLTGDNPQAAKRVAERLGFIDDVRAGLLPDQKLRAIEELRGRYGAVAMVGDGINDAPALARADVGIAMGAGTAQAMETADVVLMQDDISHVPMALRLARRSRVLVKQNIALSLGLKLAFLALAIPGITTLWMAVLADVGATMLVTLNGMRVLREK